MATTLPLMVPSLTPTSSPTRKSSAYNENSILSLNSNQNTTPISSFINANQAPITPDSCNSSSYSNKLPKIKLILKLPSSSSPKERPSSKSASSLLHKPINIPPSASSTNHLNNNNLNSSSQTVLMIDEIMNTIFDTTEILLRKNKANRESKSKRSGSDSSKLKTKTNKLRKVRTTTTKIKKTPVKSNPTKKSTKKKQVVENVEDVDVYLSSTSSSDNNTIVQNLSSEDEIEISPIERKESIHSSTSTIISNEKSKSETSLDSNSNSNSSSISSLTLSNSSSSTDTTTNTGNNNKQTTSQIESSPNQSFKLKKIKFIYNPTNDNDDNNTNSNEENYLEIPTENGKRKRKSGNQKTVSPKKRRDVSNSSSSNSSNSSVSKKLFSSSETSSSSSSPSHPIIHLKVSNESISENSDETELKQSTKKKGRKRASPTKKTTKTAKAKKVNETVLPTSQKSPLQRSPKQQPQTKSYQMSKLDRKNVTDDNNNVNGNNNTSKPTSTFKLNLSYTPSYVNKNDNSRFNSYLSSFKHKSSVVHSPSPLTNSFTFDQTEPKNNSYYNSGDYIPSKLAISTTYDPNSYKIKTQISPTNYNLWKNRNVTTSKPTHPTNTKKEKIGSIIDVLKRESQLFTSSSKKLHSKSSVSSYYGKPSLRRRYSSNSSFMDETRGKPISIQSNISNTSSIISTNKSIISSPYHYNKTSSINYRPSLRQALNLRDDSIPSTTNKPNRVRSYSTPATPKNLNDDSLRSKAHSYIQRSLTSCKSLTEKFEFHSILGYGSNGVVLGAKRRSDQLEVAIKYIYKTPSSKICEEVNILKEVSPHPSIIRYIDSFEDNNCIYLVTEKSGSSWVPSEDSNQILTCESPNTGRIVLYSTTCNTSSLFDYIELNGCVPPPEQKRMFKAIAEAVYALHSNNIVHGDIKEENILIDSHHNPKLCDFGHARHIGNNAPPHFAVYGTLELSAPELMPNLNVPAHLTKTHVVKRYNGMAQDIWALGLVLYTMTHGELPLNHSKIISKEIDLTSNKYKEYPCSYNRNISKDCVNLIRKMLTVDMKKRATIKDVLNHPWLKKK